jgi:hypothetical protein
MAGDGHDPLVGVPVSDFASRKGVAKTTKSEIFTVADWQAFVVHRKAQEVNNSEMERELAALAGDIKSVRVLLTEGANVNAKNQLGMTTLIAAVDHGRFAIVKTLLENGTDMTIKGPGVRTALWWMEQNHHQDTRQFLLCRSVSSIPHPAVSPLPDSPP